MDANKQIKQFYNLFEKKYHKILLKNIRKGKRFLIVDFLDLSKFDPGLAEYLLEDPENVIKAAEIAIEQFDLPAETTNFRVRFTNLPDDQNMVIREIRSINIGKLFAIPGVVRQKSDVRPQVTSARFECPACGNVIPVLQLDSRFKEPTRCGCGRKGKFKLLSKELVDAQGIVLEEAPEDLEGGEQPKRMNVLLKDDLVSPLTDKKTNPGSKITIVGYVKEQPIILRSGAQSTRFELLIEANNVEVTDEDYYEILISEEEEKEILDIAKDPKCITRLVASAAPSIYGYDLVKEALLLQLVGGVQKVRADGIISRGDLHVLLVGDPGAGKSQLLKRVTKIAPKGRYVSGKGVSGAGLTASVVKDEFLKGWALEAGALVLASNGICCIDELDKMSHEDRSAMHEAMEQQTISISKANIQATLISRTTILAAANPKLGRFDPFALLGEQIDLPPTLINRFDLIFPIRDLPDKDKDEKIASHILNLHQEPDVVNQDIDTQLLKKYVSYARRTSPKLTDGAIEEIKSYYAKMRGSSSTEDGASRAIPISARQLEALVRLAESSARLRLSSKVTRKDAKRGIDLLHYCLTQVGLDPDTGKIDIDRISTGIPATERGRIVTIKDIINELENSIGKTIPIEDVVRAASERNLDENDVEEVVEKLKRSGDIFEPKRGFISKI